MMTLARQVRIVQQGRGRDAIYTDLVRLPGDGRFALVNPLVSPNRDDFIRETLTESEALDKLKRWEDWPRTRPSGDASYTTREGKAWLRRAAAGERSVG